MRPDDSIGYWLSSAQRCFSAAFSELLRMHCVEQGKAYVLTPAQWGILSFVAQAQGQQQTISALAQRLGVDAPTVTNMVQRLEHCGLLGRMRDRDDQRVVQVSLSQEGRALLGSLAPAVAVFNRQVCPDHDRRELIADLQRFITRVAPLLPEHAGRFGTLRAHLAGAKRKETF